MIAQTSRPRLYRFVGIAALTAVFFLPAARAAIAAASPAVPPALQGAIERTLAKHAGPADTIRKDGCATLKTQPLTACFGKTGARFSGKDAPPVSLHLAAYGRGKALTSVKPVIPTIQGNRASYAHGNLTEWWRVLPVGFEQGFTLAKRPAGAGELMLALTASRKAASHGKNLDWGKLAYGKLVVTDAGGQVVPATLKSEGDRILISVNDAGAAYPLTVDPLVWIEQKVTANDGAANDRFGSSVALAGTLALVGASGATVGGILHQGAAYVLEDSGGTWTQTAKLTASDGAANDSFGTSVALSGASALVGAPGASGGQGAVYVFEDSGGTWTQTAKLTASDGAANDSFGTSVALAGTTALVGAPLADAVNTDQGAVYVFEDSGGTWSQTQKLTANDGNYDYYFGSSVALSGTSALVGSGNANVGSNFEQGAAYVFTESGGTWTQTQKLTANDGASHDNFGTSVALAGTLALLGAPGVSFNLAAQRGAAYLFEDSGGTWTQTQEVICGRCVTGAYFGTSVALAGTTAIVGAPGAVVDYAAQRGAAYVFEDSGGRWSHTAELKASDGAAYDHFGTSVALAGTGALVGEPQPTVNVNYQPGAVYAYTVTCPQGYGEHDGTLVAGGHYSSTPYQAPVGVENGILGGPGGFRLYLQYSNGTTQYLHRISGNEIHKLGPAGTYRWGVKAGNTGGDYVLCILHP